METLEVTVADHTGTVAVARAIAEQVRPGDAILLHGDLAAGKTTFVKAVVEALGSTEIVTSPTFTLAQFYDTDHGRILHIDAYRLDDLAEFRDLGLDDFAETSVTLVEWGEKVAAEYPGALDVTIEVTGDEARRITLRAGSPRWAGVLEQVTVTR
jgi:tRNA threonylcarbamoyladenosine biosynthesis protein TsaE